MIASTASKFWLGKQAVATTKKQPSAKSAKLPAAKRKLRGSAKRLQGDAKTSTRHSLTVEAVYERYQSRVYNLARRVLCNSTDAEDVTQDVLVQVVRKLATFRGEAGFTTWLHRVTVNAALVHRRKHTPRTARQLRGPLEFIIDRSTSRPSNFAPRIPRPDKQVIETEDREIIDLAICELPQQYRDVFILSDIEGHSNAKVQKMLRLTPAAVKSRLHRARTLMREALAPHFRTSASYPIHDRADFVPDPGAAHSA